MIEAMKLAIDYIENVPDDRDNVGHIDRKSLVLSLRQSIAELESQEPVAKVVLTETLELPCLQWLNLNRQFDFKGGEYLYTHPPKRTWVKLTDKEAQWLYDNCRTPSNLIDMVEAKLKERNS